MRILVAVVGDYTIGLGWVLHRMVFCIAVPVGRLVGCGNSDPIIGINIKDQVIIIRSVLIKRWFLLGVGGGGWMDGQTTKISFI